MFLLSYIRRQGMRCLSFLFPLAVMVIIFWFSSKPGSVSGGQSISVIHTVVSWIMPHFKEPCRTFLCESLQTPVRKLAHFSIYALLCASWIVAFRLQGHKATFWIVAAVAFSIVFALTDEYHQSFVPGRSAELGDVAIDSAGVLLVGLFASWRFGRHS